MRTSAQNRRHYERHREETKAKSRAWRAAHPDQMRRNNHAYYIANADALRARTRDRGLELRRANRVLMDDLKSVPCADCGKSYPAIAMDFDHRDGKTKSDDVASMLTRPREVILAEVAKCDVVCAICHRLRTWKRRTGSRV